MKVVHVIDSGGYYGAEVMLVHLCKAQQQLGLNVEVISIGVHGNYEKPLETKLRENQISYKPWRMMAAPDLRQSFKIINYCHSVGADVIHSHGYKGNILLGLIPKRWRKLPIISTVHGYTKQRGFSRMAIYQWLDRHCLNHLDAIVLVSDGMRHQVKEGVLGKKLHVISNGIPAEIPESASAPIPYFNEGDFKIASVGRLSYEKNFQLLINAMPLILQKIPNAKLVIYGEGGERKNLEKNIQSLNLSRFVFLPGYLDNPSSIYQNSDLFVNCSITEGMPITLLEAMRAGCLIAASDIPANREILSEISQYPVLSKLDSMCLARTIIDIEIRSSDVKISARNHLKRIFEDKYTSASTARNYLNIYKEFSNR